MKFRLICILLPFVAVSLQAQEKLRPHVPVAIVGGTLLDGYEAEPIRHSVVVFENGRITAVGQKHDTVIPDNAVIIDAGGRTVMPGLIDAHMHIDLIGHDPCDLRTCRFSRSCASMRPRHSCVPAHHRLH